MQLGTGRTQGNDPNSSYASQEQTRLNITQMSSLTWSNDYVNLLYINLCVD